MKIKKILHTGDNHCFLNKRHHEFKLVTNNIKELALKEKVDLIYIGGDIIDSKRRLSPEQITAVNYFFSTLSEICPLIIILGNHDTDLKQEGSMDSLTPILQAIEGKNPIYFLKETGIYNLYDINWAVWSCLDYNNPFEITPEYNKKQYTIGCFHGVIKDSVTDSNWLMSGTEHDISIFKDCQTVLLNDIHKVQGFRNDEIKYSGSQYQVTQDESPDKGVLIWSWDDKDTVYKNKFHILNNPFGYQTYEIYDLNSFDLKIVNPRTDDYIIRLLYVGEEENYSSIAFVEYKKQLKTLFPKNQVTLQKRFKKSQKSNSKISTNKKEDFFSTYFKSLNINKELLKQLKELDNKYGLKIDKTEYETGEYFINQVEVNNFLCFGENNVVNFDSLQGLVGLFAKNKSGKSTLLQALLFCLFNDSEKAKSSLLSLINDQQPIGTTAWVLVTLTIKGVVWKIKRSLIPKKSGTTVEIKLEVYEVIDNIEVPRHEESRPKTDAGILKKLLGDQQIFLTTVFCTAINISEFSNTKNASRLDLLIKFLGILQYDQKYKLVDEDLKKEVTIKEKLESDLSKMISDLILEQEKQELLKQQKEKELQETEFKKEIIKLITEQNELQEKYANLNVIEVKGTKEQVITLIDQLKKDKDNKQKEIDSKDLELKTYNDQWNKLIKEPILTWTSILDHTKKNTQIFELKQIIKNCNDQLNGETCPTCGSIRKEIDKTKLEQQISETDKKIKEIQVKINTETEFDKQLRNFQKKYKEIDLTLLLTQKELLETRLETGETLLKTIKDNESNLKQQGELKLEINNIKVKVDSIQDKEKEVKSFLSSVKGKITTIETQILTYKTKLEEIKQYEQSCYLYVTYKKAVHKTGIPSLVLQTYIPELNVEVNSQINDLYDINVSFELNDNTLDILFYYDEFLNDGKGKRDISQASGMEGTILNLAIRAALTKISVLPKPSILLLDEVFNTLDKDNLELVKPYLQRLKDQYYNVILISHLDELKDCPDHILTLERNEGITTIL